MSGTKHGGTTVKRRQSNGEGGGPPQRPPAGRPAGRQMAIAVAICLLAFLVYLGWLIRAFVVG